VTEPFHPAGAVPLDKFYLERHEDREYRETLEQGGDVHLHGSRQSGKTSLLIRAQTALREKSWTVAFIDLSAVFAITCETPADFSERFAAEVARDLGRPIDAARERARADGLTVALRDLALETRGPLVLMIDEFDKLRGDLRRPLLESLRALQNARARDSELRLSVSLCGVAPPLGYFNGATPRIGEELVRGRQIWLDDFSLDDGTVDRWRQGFDEPASVPREVVQAVLQHGGGYPQACAWLGNLVAAVGGTERLSFDAHFAQRLREVTAAFFDPTKATSWEEWRRQRHDTEWARVNEAFFKEHGAEARETLDLYSDVLRAHQRSSSLPYVDGDRRYELLRTSGLARLSPSDGRLRLRCDLFADAFGQAWVERVRRELQTITARRGARRSKIDRRLLILGTGGTIGMEEDATGRVIAPEPGKANWLEAIQDLLSAVEVERLWDLDSANVGPAQWRAIVDRIVKRQAECDGVVVAHGTDTMAYTASAVAFALGRELSFPVVFTGSQTTVDVSHGDAIANVLRAALVATQDLPEVVVTFGEKIFRATRTQKKDDWRFDAFESPSYPELGFIAEEVQIFGQNVLPKPEVRPQAPVTKISPDFASGILLVPQVPGSQAAFYEAALDTVDGKGESLCRGIVIQSLGAGNVPTEPPFDLTRVIRKATERGVPVVLTSQYPVLPANYLRYSPSQAAIEAGAIPTGNMTIAAVVAKLSWVLAQVNSQIERGMLPPEDRIRRVKEMMGHEYIGEGGLTVVDDADPDERRSDAAA
jgi:L-asparaginase